MFFYLADHFKTAIGATVDATTMSFRIQGHHVSGHSGFGTLESYKLEVWGPNMARQTIDIPKTGPLTKEFTGLNIFREYYSHVYYVGSGFTVKSHIGKAWTGESCKYLMIVKKSFQ